jgi:flagellar hook protein FlgE
MTLQDGFATGTLVDYAIGGDGIITGTFSNGLTQTVGQVVLATFSNPGGLVAQGNNIFLAGANSGDAQITQPLQLGAGKILGGALELSNTDLSREFINMITASTSFSANSRVISTSDQLLQELLLILRR